MAQFLPVSKPEKLWKNSRRSRQQLASSIGSQKKTNSSAETVSPCYPRAIGGFCKAWSFSCVPFLDVCLVCCVTELARLWVLLTASRFAGGSYSRHPVLLGRAYTLLHAIHFKSGCLAPWVLQCRSHSKAPMLAPGEIKAGMPKKVGEGCCLPLVVTCGSCSETKPHSLGLGFIFPFEYDSGSFQHFAVKSPLWTPCKDSALSPEFCHSPLPRQSHFFCRVKLFPFLDHSVQRGESPASYRQKAWALSNSLSF